MRAGPFPFSVTPAEAQQNAGAISEHLNPAMMEVSGVTREGRRRMED